MKVYKLRDKKTGKYVGPLDVDWKNHNWRKKIFHLTAQGRTYTRLNFLKSSLEYILAIAKDQPALQEQVNNLEVVEFDITPSQTFTIAEVMAA